MSSFLLNTPFEYLIDTSKVTSPKLNSCFPSQVGFIHSLCVSVNSSSSFQLAKHPGAILDLSLCLCLHPSCHHSSLAWPSEHNLSPTTAAFLVVTVLVQAIFISCLKSHRVSPLLSFLLCSLFLTWENGPLKMEVRSFYPLDSRHSDLWTGKCSGLCPSPCPHRTFSWFFCACCVSPFAVLQTCQTCFHLAVSARALSSVWIALLFKAAWLAPWPSFFAPMPPQWGCSERPASARPVFFALLYEFFPWDQTADTSSATYLWWSCVFSSRPLAREYPEGTDNLLVQWSPLCWHQDIASTWEASLVFLSITPLPSPMVFHIVLNILDILLTQIKVCCRVSGLCVELCSSGEVIE